MILYNRCISKNGKKVERPKRHFSTRYFILFFSLFKATYFSYFHTSNTVNTATINKLTYSYSSQDKMLFFDIKFQHVFIKSSYF